MKTESIYKSYKKCQAKSLGLERQSVELEVRGSASASIKNGVEELA
jgi:hypothetical protein